MPGDPDSAMTTETTPGSSWKRTLLRMLAVLLLCLLLAAGISLGVYQRFQNTPLNLPAGETIYEIAPGASLRQLASDLHARDMIEHPRLFILLGRELDVARRLQAGEYRLATGMTETIHDFRIIHPLQGYLDVGMTLDALQDFTEGLPFHQG